MDIPDQKEAEKFYSEVLNILIKSKIPFLIGGTYALRPYTGIVRPTKDLDIFCKVGDYQRILQLYQGLKYKTEITDARWLAKIIHNGIYVDLIFGSIQGTCPVDESWFGPSPIMELCGFKVKVMPIVELIWSKSYRHERQSYDGADINHLILKQGKNLNWKKLLRRMEPHWEILLSHLIMFRFVYPSEREIVPTWLLKELLNRVSEQFKLPTPQEKVCRGTLLSREQYTIDITEWGFQDFK